MNRFSYPSTASCSSGNQEEFPPQGFKTEIKKFVLKYIRCYTKLLNTPKNSSLNDSYLYRMNALFLYNYKFQQECIPVGCVPSAAVAVCWRGCLVRGGAWSRGFAPRGYLVLGGCLSQGDLLLGEVVSQHALRQTPCEQNHRQV